MMDIEDQIAKIIKDEYAYTGFVDQGHSTAAAHDIMAIVGGEIERLKTTQTWLAKRLRDAVNTCYGGVTHDEIDATLAGK